MMTKWQTLEEFEASPEDGIYFTYIKIGEWEEIKIVRYENDQFYADEGEEYERWYITHVMKITLPNPPNYA